MSDDTTFSDASRKDGDDDPKRDAAGADDIAASAAATPRSSPSGSCDIWTGSIPSWPDSSSCLAPSCDASCSEGTSCPPSCDASSTSSCEPSCNDLCITERDLLCQRPVCVDRSESGDFRPKIATSTAITVCEPFVPPREDAAPHAIFPRARCCRRLRREERCPTAPIVLQPDDLSGAFDAFGVTFRLDAGAVDTGCCAELADLTFPPGPSALPTTTNFASDTFLSVRSGVGVAVVNGLARPLTPGAFVYIRAGSPYAIGNSSTVAALQLFAGWIRAGSLGFYDAVAAYQRSVGGAANLDGRVVADIGRRYCIEAAALPFVFVPPGTIRLVPSRGRSRDEEDSCESEDGGDCPGGTWGLRRCQLLAITAAAVPDAAFQPVKASATIKPHDEVALLVFGQETAQVNLQARIIRDPLCGTPDIVALPTINEVASFTAQTGATYSVRYHPFKDNVVLKLAPFDE